MTTAARVPWRPVALALLAHVALVLAWPLVRAPFAPAFRAFARASVAAIDPLPGPIDVLFEPASGGILAVGLERMDTAVYLRNRELAGADASFGASSYFHAWLPLTVLLALFLAATPLPWRARGKRLAWALALLAAFVALRCSVGALHCLAKCDVDGVPVLDLGAAGSRLLFLAWHFGFGEPLANYVVPVLIWALCALWPRAERD